MTTPDVGFTLTRLLRAGEDAAAAWPTELRNGYDAQASWHEFVRDRYAIWERLIASGDFDAIPIGWTHAAVRVFGGDAMLALWGLRLQDWPGDATAEEYLRAMNAGIARERRAWERG